MKSITTEKALAAARRVSAALFGLGSVKRDKEDDDDDDLPRPNATASLRPRVVLTVALAL